MNPPTIQVRLAVVDETASIASMLRQAFVEYEALYTPEGFAATTPTADQLRVRWPEGPVWVALQADRLIGTVSAMPRGEDLYVRSMALLPEARGQGVGKLRLQQVERFAEEQGSRRMFLSTTPFLGRAIRLYEQYGFRQTGEGPHELFGTPLLTMEKVLKL